jgi:hypothetical protein
MDVSLLSTSTSCFFFSCPLPFVFSSIPFLLTYFSYSPFQIHYIRKSCIMLVLQRHFTIF